MSFNLIELQTALNASRRVARIVVAAAAGSTPREVGTSMLVWASGSRGTIGGGALEWQAMDRAQQALGTGEARFDTYPLGPALGQCCGGSVSVLTEVFDDVPENAPFARPIGPEKVDMPPTIQAAVAEFRDGRRSDPLLKDGWFIENTRTSLQPVWIYGAGHVGRALVQTLKDLPFDVVWIDSAQDRFPTEIPDSVAPFLASHPAEAVSHAPDDAVHLVLTYSHAIDQEICHRVLSRAFGHLGLIGSATKRRRFQKRLAELGHGPNQIARMACPIGNPSLGKHPSAIAIGVAHELLEMQAVACRHSSGFEVHA